MATYNAHNAWSEYMVEAANCGSDQFVAYLCAAAEAPIATDSVLADLTPITYTNLSSRNFTTNTSTHSTGTYSLDLNDLTLTASGAVETFRYAGIYDDTVTSPAADPLVCWYDYASNVTLADGETFSYSFTTVLFTVAPA